MDFPNVERVIYSKNPLTEVVCQIRFPRILAIDERIPALFQDELGAQYPYIETREVFPLALGPAIDASAFTKRTHYDFLPEDKSYTITLSSEFLAIATSTYVEWGKFLPHVQRSLSALIKCYPVSIFTRIGLRYVDTIDKTNLNIDPMTKWTSLIRKSALGLLAEDDIPVDSLVEMGSATVLSLDSGGKGVFRTAFTRDGQSSAPVFAIDSDFFTEEPVKGEKDAITSLNAFNKFAGRAFRWFITDELHAALGPNTA